MRHLISFALLFNVLLTFGQNSEKAKVTIEDIWKNYTFYPESVYGLASMADGQHYSSILNDTAIVTYSYKTGDQVQVLLTLSELNNPQIKGIREYFLSSDELKVMIYVNRKPIYRRSYTAEFWVWDIVKKQLYPVSKKGAQQLATFSPNGNQVAFVRQNNLYISDYMNGTESAITTDGQFNSIINGAPDWVYEEEFEYNQAFDWSPDGNFIGFCRFDETQVPVFNMTIYAGLAPQRIQNVLYPQNYAFKYPKAGDANSVVSVHTYNIQTQKTVKVDVGPNPDQYIPRIKWSPIGKLVIYRLNRLQNQLEFLYGDPISGASNVFYTETNPYYIDEGYFDNLTFLNNGEQFIFSSERDGYAHLYLHNQIGELVNQITKGNFDVTEYLGYNPQNKTVYYQCAESSPLNRDIYSIKIDGKGKKLLSQKQGTNEAVFSASYQYFINYFNDAKTPTYVTLHNSKGDLVRELEVNAEFNMMLENYNIQPKEFFKFTTSQGIELNGFMIKPVGFDATQKYPVLMTQYSGPNSQEALNDFQVGWEQALASEGYMVVCVDGRGTGARGQEFRKLTYLELGKYETIDQIEVAKYLGTLPFVDASRIGIWGWSFGGFMALNCITQGADYFKMAIAVAPVTNWRYYDNIYTERFMRKPVDNVNGYDLNSPINHVDKFKGKLLLVHGTADDNVHLQNSVEFSETMVQANKQFDQFYYTNRDHGIYGGNTRYHLFTKMLNYVKENL